MQFLTDTSESQGHYVAFADGGEHWELRAHTMALEMIVMTQFITFQGAKTRLCSREQRTEVVTL